MKKSSEINNIVENAYTFACKDYSECEILNVLKSDNDLEKPIAILSITKIGDNALNEALFLHLTRHDGTIREAVSFKLAELLPVVADHNIIIDALCDVNPTVCRNVITYLSKINAKSIAQHIFSRAKFFANEISVDFKKFGKNREKNHIMRKKIFHLYWLLEAYCTLFDGKLCEDITNILYMCSDFSDYTIREKTAKIVAKSLNPPVDLIEKLKNDENFYVRNIFLK